MASLADSLVRLGPARGPERCPVARLSRELPEKDALALGMALRDASIRASELGRVLREHEVLISADAIRRHRRHDCMCAVDGDAA